VALELRGQRGIPARHRWIADADDIVGGVLGDVPEVGGGGRNRGRSRRRSRRSLRGHGRLFRGFALAAWDRRCREQRQEQRSAQWGSAHWASPCIPATVSRRNVISVFTFER